jgi:hypothetical protein
MPARGIMACIKIVWKREGPQVDPILVIHRGHDGYVSFAPKNESGQWEELASVRADKLASIFPEFRDELVQDSYFGVNAFWRPIGENSKRPGLGAPYRRREGLRWGVFVRKVKAAADRWRNLAHTWTELGKRCGGDSWCWAAGHSGRYGGQVVLGRASRTVTVGSFLYPQNESRGAAGCSSERRCSEDLWSDTHAREIRILQNRGRAKGNQISGVQRLALSERPTSLHSFFCAFD